MTNFIKQTIAKYEMKVQRFRRLILFLSIAGVALRLFEILVKQIAAAYRRQNG